MTNKKTSVKASAKIAKKTPVAKKQVTKTSASAPKMEFKAIAENDLKIADKRFVSCVIGQLALNNRFELPLALDKTDDGKAVQSFGLINVERAFYALYQKMQGKLKIALDKRDADSGVFYVVIIEKTAKKTACKFSAEVRESDKKLIASSKRAKIAKQKKIDRKAQALENRADELAELANTAKKQAELVTVARDKRAQAIKQGDGKKAAALLADETASAKLALLANIKSTIIQVLPELSKDLTETLTQKIYSVVKG